MVSKNGGSGSPGKVLPSPPSGSPKVTRRKYGARKFGSKELSTVPQEGSVLWEVEQTRKMLKRQSGSVLDPNGDYMARWDIITTFFLFFTAVVTPVEVAFMEVRKFKLPVR